MGPDFCGMRVRDLGLFGTMGKQWGLWVFLLMWRDGWYGMEGISFSQLEIIQGLFLDNEYSWLLEHSVLLKHTHTWRAYPSSTCVAAVNVDMTQHVYPMACSSKFLVAGNIHVYVRRDVVGKALCGYLSRHTIMCTCVTVEQRYMCHMYM